MKKNAFANFIQVLGVGFIVFFQYRILYDHLGIDTIGIWSIVIAISSASRLLEMGLTVGVTRFVSQSFAKKDFSLVSLIIETCTITIVIIVSAFVVLVYPIFANLLQSILNVQDYEIGISLLSYTLCSLVIVITAGIPLGALDGLMMMRSRAAIILFGQFICLIITIVLLPSCGIYALVYAQIAQGCWLFFSSWFFIKRLLKPLSFFPLRFDINILKKIYSYTLKVQVANIAGILFDPITKFFLAKYGGTSSVGYFEIANQLVYRARNIVVSVNQVTLPYFARLKKSKKGNFNQIFYTNFRLVSLASTILMGVIIAFQPIYTFFITSKFDMNISLMIYACTLTWILSLIAVPAYFANFGEGSPKYNAIMMLGMTLTNITLSFMLGSFFGLIGVMFSFFISQFMGMIFLNFNFYRRHNLSIKKLGLISFSKSFTLLLFSFIAGLFLLSINANLFYILIHSCITLLLVFIIILKTDDSKLVLNLIK